MKLLSILSILAFTTSVSAGNVDNEDYANRSETNEWDSFYMPDHQVGLEHNDVIVTQPGVGDNTDDQALNELFNSYD